MPASELLAPAAEVARSVAHLVGLELLYSTVLFGVVSLLAWVWRERSPHLLHALWGLVLLRLVLPPALALPFSARNLAQHALGSGWEWLAGGASGAGTDGAAGVLSAGAGLPLVTEPGSTASPGWLLLLLGQALGTVAVALALARRRRECRRMLSGARPVEAPQVLELLRRWRAHLGIQREVRLLTSDAPLSPLTLGGSRPVVFLPGAVLRHPDPVVLESVLAHELAHVRRWDDPRLLSHRN